MAGSSNVDFIMKMERLPQRGETVTDATFAQVFGGKGANQAVGAAKAGGDVWFVSAVGDDAFGPLMRRNLAEAGMNVDHVLTQPNTSTGAALIMIGNQGENYLSVAPGANYALKPQHIHAARELVAGAAMVVTQFEVQPETLYTLIDLAHEVGTPVLFNLAPARPFDLARLAKIAILVVNETEAESLCGFPVHSEEDAVKATAKLRELGAGMVILTLGAAGVLLNTSEGLVRVPAFKVDAVDTTAAGDVFCGAFAVATVEGLLPEQAARFACAASAISVTRLGAQPSAPTRKEIEALLAV